jgi:deferrochelatase/peroxidase EfeB
LARLIFVNVTEGGQHGKTARARQLGDVGVNDPKNWDAAYGKGEVHVGVQAFSDSVEDRHRILGIARDRLDELSVSILAMQDFGAQPGSRLVNSSLDILVNPAFHWEFNAGRTRHDKADSSHRRGRPRWWGRAHRR